MQHLPMTIAILVQAKGHKDNFTWQRSRKRILEMWLTMPGIERKLTAKKLHRLFVFYRGETLM